MTWQDLKAELIIDPNYSVSEITIIENAMLAIYKIKGVRSTGDQRGQIHLKFSLLGVILHLCSN